MQAAGLDVQFERYRELTFSIAWLTSADLSQALVVARSTASAAILLATPSFATKS